MTGDLRDRIAAALEDCRTLIPDAQAEVVMAVVEPELAKLKDERNQWRRDFFEGSVQRGEIMYAQQERNEALSASMRLMQQRDDAEAALLAAGAALRDLMCAAEHLVLDWPNPATPEHRQAATRAIQAVERRFADIINAGLDMPGGSDE